MDMPSAKIRAARQAAKVAVDEIVDGTWFAVVSANTTATMCYPLQPQMARMDSTARAAAKEAIDDLRPQGSTAIGNVAAERQRAVRHGAGDAASRHPPHRRQDRG